MLRQGLQTEKDRKTLPRTKQKLNHFPTFMFQVTVESCRSHAAFVFFANKRLVNHVIKTEEVPDMEMLCFNEHDRVSCNFENNVGSDAGAHKCELNNSTQQEYEEDFLDTCSRFLLPWDRRNVKIIQFIVLSFKTFFIHRGKSHIIGLLWLLIEDIACKQEAIFACL